MRRRTFFIVFGIIILAIIGCTLVFNSPEPSDKGRPLSEWMEIYASSGNAILRIGEDSEQGILLAHQREVASNALCRIGSQAVPFLSKWMEYEPPRWNRWLDNYLSKTRYAKSPLAQNIRKNLQAPEHRVAAAIEVVKILGPSAEGAVPALTKLLKHSNFDLRIHGSIALARIGPKGSAPLMDALANPATPGPDMTHLTLLIATMGTNGRPAIPVLIRCLHKRKEPGFAKTACDTLAILHAEPSQLLPGLSGLSDVVADPMRRNVMALRLVETCGPAASNAAPSVLKAMKDTDPMIRNAAGQAMWSLKPAPNLAVPALIDVVADPTLRNRFAITYLGHLGPAASNAIPALLKALEDPNPDTRRILTNALDQIDPTAIGNPHH